MKFLVLTDLHIVEKDTSQDSVFGTLFSHLDQTEESPFDGIILLGDMAYSGKTEEYDRFAKLVLHPARSRAQLGAPIISVPGNHDMDCRDIIAMPWATIGSKKQAAFLEPDDRGRTLRKPRTAAFRNYSEFLDKEKITGVNPLDSIASVATFNNITFISTVSCIFADPDHCDKLSCPAPTPSLRHLHGEGNASQTTIVLSHYPIDWFSHDDQTRLRSFLQTTCSFILHGHLHEMRATYNDNGVEAVGFGAAKVRRLDDGTPSKYTNSFSVVNIAGDHLKGEAHTWDIDVGKWVPRTAFPSGFKVPNRQAPHEYTLPLPKRGGALHQVAVAPTSPPLKHRTSRVVLLDDPDKLDWTRLLKLLRLIDQRGGVSSVNDSPGTRTTIDQVAQDVRRRVQCLSSPGSILSLADVATQNAAFDAERLQSLTIVSLGDITDDARILATKLSAAKQFYVKTNTDLAAALDTALGSYDKLRNACSSPLTIEYVLVESSVNLLAIDEMRAAFFAMYDENGDLLPEHHQVVVRMRERRSSLATTHYGFPAAITDVPSKAQEVGFQREGYLAVCRREFDSIRYAGLSTLGIKLPKAKLTDIYVDASAETRVAGQAAPSFRNIVSDFLDSLNLDEAQRVDLEAQLLEQEARPDAEASSAKLLYQKSGCVLVLGDPGSGKTCFAKNEILSYAKEGAAGWYGAHVPLFVSLSELANEFEPGAPGNASANLIGQSAAIAARHGFPIVESQLRELISAGRVAFFYDGIDEVSDTDVRGKLWSLLTELIASAHAHGNRFVVTSRPSAVNELEIPDPLKSINLVGLTDEDVEVLAGRLVGLSKGRFQRAELDDEDKALVERLLAARKSNAGIRRLSSNPLLLTLLVSLLLNHGGISVSKRHRIYEQAVRTLVSVRNRESNSALISESDLWERLGGSAVALWAEGRSAVFRRKTLVDHLHSIMEKTNPKVTYDEADKFVAHVADATGLISIEHRPPSSGGDIVAFVHHSFLEYYLALGLQAVMPVEQSRLRDPKWREVVVLLAGLLGDQGNAQPLFQLLLQDADDGDDVSAYRLILAVDCATECDVPSEHIQRLIAAAIQQAMASGAGRGDSEFRGELAEHLSPLLETTRSKVLEEMLALGLTSIEPTLRAAYVDLVGRLGQNAPGWIRTTSLVETFDSALDSRNSQLRVSLMGAIERCPELRTDKALTIVEECFEGSLPVRFSVARLVASSLSIAQRVQRLLPRLLDDKQSVVASLAAIALLHLRPNFALADDEAVNTFRKSAERLRSGAFLRHGITLRLTGTADELDRLLTSPDTDRQKVGLRLAPWLERQEAFAFQRLIAHLRGSKDDDMKKVCLEALCANGKILSSASYEDIEYLIGELSTIGRQDLRILCARVLIGIGQDAALHGVIESLAQLKDRERTDALLLLAEGHPRRPDVKQACLLAALEVAKEMALGRFGAPLLQRASAKLLEACASLELDSQELAAGCLRVADDYRAPERVRRSSRALYAKNVRPSKSSVETLRRWLNHAGAVAQDPVGDPTILFARRLRQGAAQIRPLVDSLSALRTDVIAKWRGLDWGKTDGLGRLEDARIRSLRKALNELDALLTSHLAVSRLREATQQEGTQRT